MTPPSRLGSVRQPMTSTVKSSGPLETGGLAVCVGTAADVASLVAPGVPLLSEVGVTVMISVPVTGVAVATPISGAGVLTGPVVAGGAIGAVVGASGGRFGVTAGVAGPAGVGAAPSEPSEQAMS